MKEEKSLFQVWYVCVEEPDDVLIVYKNCVFTAVESCIKLKKEAELEYGEGLVEICNFLLNPRIV